MNALDDPYRLLVRVSLLLATAGGFGLGLALLLGFAFSLPLAWNVGALIQVHGQVQTLGFIALFILAVGTRLLPRFHATTLRNGRQASLGGLALALGVAGRAIVQPLGPSSGRSVILVASGLLCLIGALVAVAALARSVRQGRPPEAGEPALLPITMVTSLLGALALTVAASIRLAAGDVVVPGPLDEALVHLELWGFASTMVLAIARHTWPAMLLLQPGRRRWIQPSLACWMVGALGTPLAWLLVPDSNAVRLLTTGAQLAGAVGYVVALRLFDPPARRAGLPQVTDAARTWMRVAFLFLLAGAAANCLAASGGELGSSVVLVRLSAARHFLALGFLLPVIVFMAGRMLPGYSASMMAHPARLGILLWVLFLGAMLRVGGELLGGYGDGWNLAVALGATLTVAGFLAFAIPLWGAAGSPTRPTDRVPRAQSTGLRA